MMNEKLVAALMAQSDESTPDGVRLRLVVEEGGDAPNRSEEVSLAEAIETSLDLGLDLVEIDLDNPKLPVVRAVDYDSKKYRMGKERSKKKADPGGVVKEFRLKAKTADHDFDRKIDAIVAALQKGHKCKVQATCARRALETTNPEGAEEVLQRLLERVKGYGVANNPPEVNKEKVHGTVLLKPIGKKEKKKKKKNDEQEE